MAEPIETTCISKPAVAVDLQRVEFKYRDSLGLVVNIEKWQLLRGATAFIYGASGSGKSTLLNLIAGLLVSTQGSVKVMGEDLSQYSGARRDRFRAQHIGVIFQQFNLIPWLTVQDNISAAYYFAAKKNFSKAELAKRITEVFGDN